MVEGPPWRIRQDFFMCGLFFAAQRCRVHSTRAIPFFLFAPRPHGCAGFCHSRQFIQQSTGKPRLHVGSFDAVDSSSEAMNISRLVDDAVAPITLTECVACIFQCGHECRARIAALPELGYFGFDLFRVDPAFGRPEVFPVGNLAALALAWLRGRRGWFVGKFLLQFGAGFVMRKVIVTVRGYGQRVGIDPAPDNVPVGSPLLLVFDLKADVTV